MFLACLRMKWTASLKIDCEVSFLVARFRELVICEGTSYFAPLLKNCVVMHSHFVVSNVNCCEGTDYMMEGVHQPMLDLGYNSNVSPFKMKMLVSAVQVVEVVNFVNITNCAMFYCCSGKVYYNSEVSCIG